jgi:DNA polymerase III epsilon subunit-like protein
MIICSYGCGKEAKYFFKTGNGCCEKSPNSCEGKKNKDSEKKKGKFKSRSLKDLVKEFLKIDIQGGEHDPCEDARSAVMLYRYKMKDWEISLNEKQLEIKQKKWSNKSKKSDNKHKVDGIKTGIFASDNSKNSVIKIQDI